MEWQTEEEGEMRVVVCAYVLTWLAPLAYPAIAPCGRGRRGPEPGWHRACCRCQQCRGSCPGVVENAAAQDVCNGDRLREGRRTVRNHRGRESLLCRFRSPLPLDRPGLRYADPAGHHGGAAARDESRLAWRLGPIGSTWCR